MTRLENCDGQLHGQNQLDNYLEIVERIVRISLTWVVVIDDKKSDRTCLG